MLSAFSYCVNNIFCVFMDDINLKLLKLISSFSFILVDDVEGCVDVYRNMSVYGNECYIMKDRKHILFLILFY